MPPNTTGSTYRAMDSSERNTASSASDGVVLATLASDCSRYTSTPAISTSATPKPSTAMREIARVASSAA